MVKFANLPSQRDLAQAADLRKHFLHASLLGRALFSLAICHLSDRMESKVFSIQCLLIAAALLGKSACHQAWGRDIAAEAALLLFFQLLFRLLSKLGRVQVVLTIQCAH
eukprot:306035-Hanusia_phi.AAC.1